MHMKMKFMITAVVSVLAAANLFAAIPEPPKGHESDSCVRVSNVVAVKGNPCKVVFKDHDAMHPCEIVVYYDSEGKAFMETRERKQRRMNGRGDIVYRPEVNETFVGERGEYLWRYAEGFVITARRPPNGRRTTVNSTGTSISVTMSTPSIRYIAAKEISTAMATGPKQCRPLSRAV